MNQQYNHSFKVDAVKKALSRNENSSVKSVADSLNVASSTLHTWINRAKNNQLELGDNIDVNDLLKQEKSPHHWTLDERFKTIIECEGLPHEAISQKCREQGIHLHHLKDWKNEFLMQKTNKNTDEKALLKTLKEENKQLRREINRKDRALAETAALLVFQKKSKLFGETTRKTHHEIRAEHDNPTDQ